MPNFLYTVVLVSLISWYGWYKTFVFKSPEKLLNIVVFLITLFVSLTSTLSVVLFFIIKKKAIKSLEPRNIYRKVLRWSSLISFVIVGYLGLRAFELKNPIYLGFLVLLCVGLAIKLKD